MILTEARAEIAPEQEPEETIAERAGLRKQCPYCSYEHLPMIVAGHIKRAHPEHWTGPTKAPARKKQTRERPPRQPEPKAALPGPKRVSVADDVAEIAGGLADGLELVGLYPATANCLQFCAPALGVVVDDAIAGTKIDRAVQRIARRKGKYGGVGDVAMLLAIVAASENQPVLREALKERARGPMRRIAIKSAAVRKRQAAAEKAAITAFAELADFLDDDALRASEDPAGDLFEGFFAPWVDQVEEDDGPPVE
ncbi:MAG: hypothetical protein M0Z69_04005 [Actinomycetota bacterium]|nr:hypothetical protein [Actinomycetota bacterium]